MRFAISLALFAACTLLVLLTAVKPVRSTELALAATGAATMAPSGSPAADRAGDDGNPIEGRRIFMRENCYVCHGGFAGGGMCPSLRHSRPDDDDVREVVRNGTRNGMPPFPELTEVDIQNLCAYFQSLRTPEEPTFTHWWEPVPTQ